jgi:hypothetical protein
LIKLWLIVASGSIWASNSYRFGYFDEAKPAPLKPEVISKWLRDGLRVGGVKGAVQAQVKVVGPESTDEELRSIDFLILRADLQPARALADRYHSLGGLMAISDQWTREDLGIENFAVLSVSLPSEKRITPMLGWMNNQALASKVPKRAAYITQSDSDFDKIWFFELFKNLSAKGWDWQEIAVAKTDTKIDFIKHKASESFVLLNRMNPELIPILNASSHLPLKMVVAVDPVLEKPNDKVAEYFKKNIMTYYVTTYPKGLTDEARDFEKSHKEAMASDALLHDALVLMGKALAKSAQRVNTRANFFGALDGLELKGVSGEIKIDRGLLWREIFIIAQRGDDRVLEWRSGLVK